MRYVSRIISDIEESELRVSYQEFTYFTYNEIYATIGVIFSNDLSPRPQVDTELQTLDNIKILGKKFNNRFPNMEHRCIHFYYFLTL